MSSTDKFVFINYPLNDITEINEFNGVLYPKNIQKILTISVMRITVYIRKLMNRNGDKLYKNAVNAKS